MGSGARSGAEGKGQIGSVDRDVGQCGTVKDALALPLMASYGSSSGLASAGKEDRALVLAYVWREMLLQAKGFAV